MRRDIIAVFFEGGIPDSVQRDCSIFHDPPCTAHNNIMHVVITHRSTLAVSIHSVFCTTEGVQCNSVESCVSALKNPTLTTYNIKIYFTRLKL